MSERIAIIAAMEREIAPLVRGWQRLRLTVKAHAFGGAEARSSGNGAAEPELLAYESHRAVAVISGIGGVHARRAAEAVIASERPCVVISAGFAGALDPRLGVGAILQPETVWDAASGESFCAEGRGVLASTESILDAAGKGEVIRRYRADAVDMEAAAVAGAARRHEVRFLAVKAISDDPGFPMPRFEPFIDARGDLHTGRLTLSAVTRPALWPVLWRLRANTLHASRELCLALTVLIRQGNSGLAAPAPGKQDSR
jgi:adenosylhomocysteine nucleosidase